MYSGERIKKTLLVVAAFCMLALFAMRASAQEDVINSARLENPVTIDGSIGADEWTDATKIEVGAVLIGEGTSHIYFKNDDEYLYILYNSSGTGGTGEDWDAWIFGIDVDNNGDWTPQVDASLVFIYNETAEPQWLFVFQVANENPPQYKPITNETYSAGIVYSGVISENHPILEVMIPLSLIGINGTEGGTVGWYMLHATTRGGFAVELTYLNIWPSEGKWVEDQGKYVEGSVGTWGDLVIAGAPTEEAPPPEEGPPPAPGIPTWVWPTVLVVAIVIIIVIAFLLPGR